MPRKKRKVDPIEQVAAEANLTTADQLPTLTPLSPPEPVLEPISEPKIFVEALNRPTFAPVPSGFMDTAKFVDAGIRVNKRLSGGNTIVAIQFAEDRLPSRDEKDALQISGYDYNENRRQWERNLKPGEPPGAVVIETQKIARVLSDAREGRGV